MVKLNKSMLYGMIGAGGGLAGVVTASGACSPGACWNCCRCVGMGVILACLALWQRKKEEVHHAGPE